MERFMFDFMFTFATLKGVEYRFKVTKCDSEEEAESLLDHTHIWHELGCEAHPTSVVWTPSEPNDDWDADFPF
jgi:hypothetical protein